MVAKKLLSEYSEAPKSQPPLLDRPIPMNTRLLPNNVNVHIYNKNQYHAKWCTVVKEACLAHKLPTVTLVTDWRSADFVLVPTWRLSPKQTTKIMSLIQNPIQGRKIRVVPFMLKGVESVPSTLQDLTQFQGCEAVTDREGMINEAWVKYFVGGVIEQALPPQAIPRFLN